MKKMLAAATAALVTMGGVALTAPAANAADCGYPTCQGVNGNGSIKSGTREVGKRLVVKYSAKAEGSTLTPTGKVTVIVKQVKGAFKFRDSRGYNGDTVKIPTKKLTQPGKYKVKVIFDSNPNGIFADDVETFTITVTR